MNLFSPSSFSFSFVSVKFRQPCQPFHSHAQHNLSSIQNRVGALVTHHPAWMSHHAGGSRQGHPRCTNAQTLGRPWVARSRDQPVSSSSSARNAKVMLNRVVSPTRSTSPKRSMSNERRVRQRGRQERFINKERGVNNAIGEESATNNKFDEKSITNDKIE